jgi:hypothetical protein
MTWKDFLNPADLVAIAEAKAMQRNGVDLYRRVYERARKRLRKHNRSLPTGGDDA